MTALARRLGDRCSATASALRPSWVSDDVLSGVRWGLTIVWAGAFVAECVRNGVPFYRSDLLVWLVLLLAATSVGRRSVFTILIDFVPFAAVLVTYDYLRGFADTLGMPTWWHPQLDVDRFLFFGHEPTVWLQEHLKHSYTDVRWYDIAVTLCYCSFFFLPYVTAAVMWWRSRRDFYRWSLRFVSMSFLGFACFALIPAAPPWAAGHCTAAQVAGHPSGPVCMYGPGRTQDSILGNYVSHTSGNPWVERGWSTIGLEKLHLHLAALVIKAGQGGTDAVAAVPSLHLGGTMLFCLFMWSRVRRWWRPVLVAYPLFMTFSLAYTAEHYVSDCLAGALLAVGVHLGAHRIERWRKRRCAPDTLELPPESTRSTLESPCPPTPHPTSGLPATTRSST